MIAHISPSNGQRCGIATFADRLNKHLDNSEIVTTIGDVSDKHHAMLIEHEYGLHYRIDWSGVSNFNGMKVTIQHAFSPIIKYKDINAQVFKLSNKVLFLTNKCRIEACNVFPEFASKFSVMPHYTENLIGEPKMDVPDDYVIGIHGFAFPRNGFMKLLNAYGNKRLFIMSSISEFNPTAELETSTYVDKIRRKVWDINDQVGKEVIRIVFDYHNSKQEIIQRLRDNCNILTHLSSQPTDYFNASGSVTVLLATGLPVFALNSPATGDIPEDVLGHIDNASDLFSLDTLKSKMTHKADAIVQYHDNNSVKNFATRVAKLFNL